MFLEIEFSNSIIDHRDNTNVVFRAMNMFLFLYPCYDSSLELS